MGLGGEECNHMRACLHLEVGFMLGPWDVGNLWQWEMLVGHHCLCEVLKCTSSPYEGPRLGQADNMALLSLN